MLAGREQHLAIGRPADVSHACRPERAAGGQAALERHGVNLGRAFVLAHERDGLAVGRDGGIGLVPGAGRETGGDATGRGNLPQITLADEDDGLAVDGGLAVVALGLGDGVGGKGRASDSDDNRSGEPSGERARSHAGTSGRERIPQSSVASCGLAAYGVASASPRTITTRGFFAGSSVASSQSRSPFSNPMHPSVPAPSGWARWMKIALPFPGTAGQRL
jgi:hypothetical protein